MVSISLFDRGGRGSAGHRSLVVVVPDRLVRPDRDDQRLEADAVVIPAASSSRPARSDAF
jgi:hypothetical protein